MRLDCGPRIVLHGTRLARILEMLEGPDQCIMRDGRALCPNPKAVGSAFCERHTLELDKQADILVEKYLNML